MACALSQGYVLDCRDNAGGAREIRIAGVNDVEEFTVTASVVTAVTNVATKRWWSWKPAKDTVYGKFTPTANIQNGTLFYAQEVAMAVNKLQTNLSIEIGNISKNTIYIALKDSNGKYWLYGYRNGMDVTGGEHGTGTAMGDRNGYNIVWTGQEPEMPLEIDQDTWDTLETPGV